MAKQTRIPGTEDKVPKAVQDAADAYATALRALNKAREKKNGHEAALIEKMQAADVHQVYIFDGEKRILLTDKAVVQVKKCENKDVDTDDPEE